MNHHWHHASEYLFGKLIELIAFLVRWGCAIEDWKASVEHDANL